MVGIDPSGVDYHAENANEYISKLDSLDAFMRSEFAGYEKVDFIAFHDAFSYFAKRCGPVQHRLLGVQAEQEELWPEKLGQVINLARELRIATIYSEELVDPPLANVIAGEILNSKW